LQIKLEQIDVSIPAGSSARAGSALPR
jgi:hypothetical protein